jgi:cell volume regulation protein A
VTLATAGVVVTATVVGIAAVYGLGLDWSTGLLVGAIISSTDAAAVFSVLRSRSIGVSKEMRSLLEFESGSNDPTAVFLTTALIAISLAQGMSTPAMVALFAYKLAGGAILGFLLGRALVWGINKVSLEYEGLYPVLSLAAAGVIFGLGELIQTSGFMAVYVAGLAMANQIFIHRNSIMRFHDGLAWLMQITMFLMLGLFVTPSDLPEAAGAGALIAIVLMVVARPVSVFLSLIPSKLSLKEKTFVSWVGLRGAAPIVLATFALVADVPNAQWVFNVVFFTVIMSVLIQAPTISKAAAWLGVKAPLEPDVLSPLELNTAEDLGVKIKRLVVPDNATCVGGPLYEIGGPSKPLVVMLRRGGRIFVPTGSTVLDEGDELFCLGAPESIAEMREVLKPCPDA